MAAQGINLSLLLAQLINLATIVVWFVLAALALVHLWRYPFSARERFVWSMLIVLIPLFGAIAFFLLHPKKLPAKTIKH